MFSGHLIGAEKARRNRGLLGRHGNGFRVQHKIAEVPPCALITWWSDPLPSVQGDYSWEGLGEAVLSPEALPRTQTPHFTKDMEAGITFVRPVMQGLAPMLPGGHEASCNQAHIQ